LDHCDILAYCLMPNHFHLLIYIKQGAESKKISNAIAVILRSYTQAINLQETRTGSLFQQKTKSVELKEINHPVSCFHYIHHNPVKAKLVTKMEDWHFSSFRDYSGLRNGSLCNFSLACRLLSLPENKQEFNKLSNDIFNDAAIKTYFWEASDGPEPSDAISC